MARKATTDDLDPELDKISSEIESVQKEIVNIETVIQTVMQTQMSSIGEDLLHRREREKLLRDKEKQLRDEKKQLRDKEKQLRDEKNLHIQLAPFNIGDTRPAPIDQPSLEFVPRYPSSQFVASKGQHCISCLYNGLKAISFNYPEIVRDAIEMDIPEEDIRGAETSVRQGHPRTMFPVMVSESKTTFGVSNANIRLSVEKITGDALQSFFASNHELAMTCKSEAALASFGAINGPATPESHPDFLTVIKIQSKEVPMGSIELKSTIISPVEQTGPAFACGGNIALLHQSLGLDSSKIAVPLIMTNGHLYSFAMVSLLDHVPVLHIVTDVLDTNKGSDFVQIARFLATFKAFVMNQGKALQKNWRPWDARKNQYIPVPFPIHRYHLKPQSESAYPSRPPFPTLW